MWRVLGLAAICSWLVGCSLESGALLPSGPADSSPPADSAVDARIDATTDAPSDAMDAMLDAGDATTDAPMPPCAPSPAEDDVVALFSFEDIEGASSTFDTISGREGRVLRGPAVSVEGVGDCGRAFYMPDDSDTIIVVADSPDWDLPTGSVDLWFSTGEASSPPSGLVARDAGGEARPGHFRVQQTFGHDVTTRLQAGSAARDPELRSPSVPTESWHHVGVNWGTGGFELWVDGVRVDTSTSTEYGIDGNDNPWLIGATNSRADEGSDPPTSFSYPADDVAIDHFRISSVRRDFSSYAALVP